MKTTLTLILASDMNAAAYGRGFACATMNDTTPKQIAAAKPTVNNGSAIWI
jgi:hypothetical protein